MPVTLAPPHTAATILVVDDELSLRRAVARFFARRDSQVIEAADGAMLIKPFDFAVLVERVREPLVIRSR